MNLPLTARFAAVVGSDDNSRSLVATALHLLGVPMGVGQPKSSSPTEWLADVSPGLVDLCQQFFDEHDWSARSNQRYQVSRLRWWAHRRERLDHGAHGLLGGSHALLGLMPESLSEAWNRPLVIRVNHDVSSVSAEIPVDDPAFWACLQCGLSAFDSTQFRDLIDVELNAFESPGALVNFLVAKLGLAKNRRSMDCAIEAIRTWQSG